MNGSHTSRAASPGTEPPRSHRSSLIAGSSEIEHGVAGGMVRVSGQLLSLAIVAPVPPSVAAPARWDST